MRYLLWERAGTFSLSLQGQMQVRFSSLLCQKRSDLADYNLTESLGYSFLRGCYSLANYYTNGLGRPLDIRGLLKSPFLRSSAENVDNRSASIRKCKVYLSWKNIVRICIMHSVVLSQLILKFTSPLVRSYFSAERSID